MSEIPFNIQVNQETIYGVVHYSENKNIQRNYPVVIFLHGWAGYRTGPHDMYVKMARSLTKIGHCCVRFDFRGRGYSQGNKNATNNRTMLADLNGIIDYIDQTLHSPRKILIGICSGAKLALYYAKSGSKIIDNVIAISSPVLRLADAGNQLMINYTKRNLILYVKKIFFGETWEKLIHGEVYWGSVLSNVFKPILYYFKNKRKISNISSTLTNRESFGNFDGKILLIHGEEDPETVPALKQIKRLLEGNNVYYNMHIVKGANHSFYSLKWEKEVIEIIKIWLKS